MRRAAWTLVLVAAALLLAGAASAHDPELPPEVKKRSPMHVGEYGPCGKITAGPRKTTWTGCAPLNAYFDAYDACAAEGGKIVLVCATPTPGVTATPRPTPTPTYAVRRCPTSCPRGKICDPVACDAFGSVDACSCWGMP